MRSIRESKDPASDGGKMDARQEFSRYCQMQYKLFDEFVPGYAVRDPSTALPSASQTETSLRMTKQAR